MYSTGIEKYKRRSNQCSKTDKQVKELIIKYDIYACHDEKEGPILLDQLKKHAEERGIDVSSFGEPQLNELGELVGMR